MKKLKTCEYCQNEFNPKESHSQLYCSSQCLYQGKRRKTLETNRKRYGCDAPAQNPQIKQKVKSYFVEKFGVENPFQNQDIKKRIKSSNLEKYGVENVALSDTIKERKMSTCKERYGCDFAVSSQKVKQLIKQRNLEKYGASNVFAVKPIQEKIKETNLRKYGIEYPIRQYRKLVRNVSKLQLLIENLLLVEKIQFDRQFQLGRYLFDFKINDVLIEVNGDFWHANPLFYQQNQEINYPRIGKKLAKQIWAKDKEKYQYAIKLGYKVIYLWQNQIKGMSGQQLIKQIRKYL